MKKSVGVIFFIISVIALGFFLRGAYATEAWPHGTYPGKWYGMYGPLKWIPPVAGVNTLFRDQKVIKSWGYQANDVDEIKDLLIPIHYNMLKHPEIWGDARINLTKEIEWQGAAYEKFKADTEKYKGTCFVAEDGSLNGGDPFGYKSGCPFPNPKNGDEVIWNLVKRFRAADRSMPWIMPVVDRTGKTRYLAGENLMVYFNGRLMCEPSPLYEPNPKGYEYMQTFGYMEPYDLRGTTPLFYRYTDPKKMDDMWMYIPSLRRVRRMSAAQRCDRVPGGSDVTWDLFEGFAGKPSMYNFTLVGRKMVLGARCAKPEPQYIKGKHMCGADQYFQKINYYIVEAVPKDTNWIYSKIVIYIDPVLFYPDYSVTYDRKGREWLFWYYAWDTDVNFMTGCANMTMIDIQRIHSSNTMVRRGEYNKCVSPSFFTMQNLKKHFGAAR